MGPGEEGVDEGEGIALESGESGMECGSVGRDVGAIVGEEGDCVFCFRQWVELVKEREGS